MAPSTEGSAQRQKLRSRCSCCAHLQCLFGCWRIGGHPLFQPTAAAQQHPGTLRRLLKSVPRVPLLGVEALLRRQKSWGGRRNDVNSRKIGLGPVSHAVAASACLGFKARDIHRPSLASRAVGTEDGLYALCKAVGVQSSKPASSRDSSHHATM